MDKLRKVGGMAAITEACIYILLFTYFAAYHNYPAGAGVAEKLSYLKDHRLVISVMYLIGYVGFGIALAVLVLAVHDQIRQRSPVLSRLSAIFGILWVGLVIAAGMLADASLAAAVGLASKDSERAFSIYSTISVVVEGIGGGNEIVGGLWVLLVSIAAIGGAFSRPLSYFGILVGVAGVATIVPGEWIKQIFGLSQILWFAWLGVSLLRNR
ncbi:MAG: hypothetical protein JNN30_04220 [Rhodanobacteraceae bacterium]|nr:hypothetical protein [Rhodanobacteraceae bacterium]